MRFLEKKETVVWGKKKMFLPVEDFSFICKEQPLRDGMTGEIGEEALRTRRRAFLVTLTYGDVEWPSEATRRLNRAMPYLLRHLLGGHLQRASQSSKYSVHAFLDYKDSRRGRRGDSDGPACLHHHAIVLVEPDFTRLIDSRFAVSSQPKRAEFENHRLPGESPGDLIRASAHLQKELDTLLVLEPLPGVRSCMVQRLDLGDLLRATSYSAKRFDEISEKYLDHGYRRFPRSSAEIRAEAAAR